MFDHQAFKEVLNSFVNELGSVIRDQIVGNLKLAYNVLPYEFLNIGCQDGGYVPLRYLMILLITVK